MSILDRFGSPDFMPMPTRRSDEEPQAFISRCIGNADVRDVAKRQAGGDASGAEINKVAAAICNSQLRRGENALSDAEVAAMAAEAGIDLAEFAMVEGDENCPECDAEPGTPHKADCAMAKRNQELAEHREHGMDLKGVEIFKVGTWNGDKYTEKDLDDMVAAFERVGFRPPVKLGHSDEVGEPAYGWVDAIRRVGDKLVADFSDLPEAIYQAIKDRRYDSVSSEIFFNLKRGTEKFRRALKAVALLGAEIPGVAGLAPLRESFSGLTTKAHSYTLDVEDLTEEDDMPKDKAQQLQEQIDAANAELEKIASDGDPEPAEQEPEATPKRKRDNPLEVRRLQEQLDALNLKLEEERAAKRKAETVAKAAQQREPELQAKIAELKEQQRRDRIDQKVEQVTIPALREHFQVLYDLASADAEKVVTFTFSDGQNREVQATPEEVVDDLVRRLNSQASRLFQELTKVDVKRTSADETFDDPGIKLDRLTRVHMSRHSESDYMKAFNAVRSDPANADLVQAYAQRGN